jgi:hypothetical protein
MCQTECLVWMDYLESHRTVTNKLIEYIRTLVEGIYICSTSGYKDVKCYGQ